MKEKNLTLTTAQFRAKCDEFSEGWIATQTKQFKRVGVLADHGFSVVTTESGEEALELYRRHSPDVVFLDVWLPDRDGLETLALLREADPEAAAGEGVVKPNAEGSSVGVVIVPAGANRPPQLAPSMPETVLVEEYVAGRELTVAVLGDRPLAVTDIIADGWYDYDAKYRPGGSRHVVPAEIPAEITQACLDIALRAHRALGCRGLSRSDFRWDEGRGLGGLVILEINTQPGMTPTSLAPEQAAHVGMSFGALVRWLVEDASCSR